MHKLARIITQMSEEADGAVGYAMCAEHLHTSDRELADMYLSMAKQEIEHFEKLAACGSKQLAAYEAEHSDDQCTRALYEHCEQQSLKKMAEAKVIIESYR